jgi:hypothetical protein
MQRFLIQSSADIELTKQEGFMQRMFIWGLMAFVMSHRLASGVTIGQIDTFETGLDNWFAGGLGPPPTQTPPIPPFVAPSGGPSGAGDAYMVITASERNGAGSRVVAINGSQWAGDYISAGIGSIAMDLNNLGMTDLTIRLLFEDPIGGPPADEAVTNFGAFLPVGSGWMHFVFPISPFALTAVDGSPAAALSNATLMRIINAPTVGDAARQLGVLGVDNIASQSAAAVPEPSTVLFALTGFASLVFLRRRR